MREYLNLLHNKALSSQDIWNALGGNCNILTYPQLMKVNDIMQVLNKPLILLYMTHERFGHWCCLIKHNDRIEFFDSYGIIIDDQLKKIDEIFRIKSGQNYPHLLKLLYNSGYKIEYNHIPLQKKYKSKIETVATCGRHCICRIWFKDLKLKDYIKFIKKNIKKGIDADDIVVFLTQNI